MRKRAVIICPGRGTYNAGELGYLARHHGHDLPDLAAFDAIRRQEGQVPLATLDGASAYDAALHTRGDNASALIFAASYLDARAVSAQYDVVAVTGNSMGWYSALAVAGAASATDAFGIVNTMGTLMQKQMIGGQSLYPFVDAQWRAIPGKEQELQGLVDEIASRPDHALAVSINLGGMLVVAGNSAGLDAFEAHLPPLEGRYPMRLVNHAAFHTRLQVPVAAEGQAALPVALFRKARLPLVDGRGEVWWPGTYTPERLRYYTLHTQVLTAYDFAAAIRVAARTFAPDVFIVTGPGTTLGSSVAQSLIRIDWRGLSSKRAFLERQTSDPVLLSMGRAEDRARATT